MTGLLKLPLSAARGGLFGGFRSYYCIFEGKIPQKPGAVETGHADGRFQRALQECSTPLGRKLRSSQLVKNNQLWESLIGQQ